MVVEVTEALSRPKWHWYFLLIGLILASNSALYYSSLFETVPSEAVWGSVFDLLIMIPLLTYLFILRKRYSIKSLGIVILGCYLAVYFIIPTQHLQNLSMIPYVILAFEAIFVCIELYILYQVISKLPKIIGTFRIENSTPYFYTRAIHAFSKHLTVNRMIKVLLSELTMIHYALFSWKKKPPEGKGKYFTYHKNSSVIMVYVMLIHATVLETFALHVLIHEWSIVLSWGLLVLNVYGVLFFIGEIHAIRLSPFMVKNNELHLQVGLTKNAVIPFESIEQLRPYDGPEKLSKLEQKRTLDATVKDIFNEKPSMELVLHEKVNVHYIYGFKKNVDRILLNVDDPEGFKVALNQ